MKYTASQRQAHFFHVVSNIRPIVWIGLYICVIPIFALIYWALPDNQFRIPEGDATGFGSWIYYSIVTISTLGFGDYTPAHGAAQAVTAIEVMCGLIFLGLFLNAVGAMKSEIDVESEVEKQRLAHHAIQHEKLVKSIPAVFHTLNLFLSYCYAVTTPTAKRYSVEPEYNPDFTFNDLSGMFEPSGLPFDRTTMPAVTRLLDSASHTSIALDSLQQRVDLTLWPEILESCFAFVANCQLFSNMDMMFRNPDHIILENGSTDDISAEKQLSKKIEDWKPDEENPDPDLKAVGQLFSFIKENASIARKLETDFTRIASEKEEINN